MRGIRNRRISATPATETPETGPLHGYHRPYSADRFTVSYIRAPSRRWLHGQRDHREGLRSGGAFVGVSRCPILRAMRDFGEADAIIAGVKYRAHFFVMTLPHSDACFVAAYPAATTEAWLDGHNRACGGVPQSLYDNDKCLVSRRNATEVAPAQSAQKPQNDLTLARHRPSLAKSQRACRQSLAWGKRGRAKLARIYHRPINRQLSSQNYRSSFRSSLDTSIKPILCPRSTRSVPWIRPRR